MCGITGIIGLGNVYSELVDAMKQQKHRGLDGFGLQIGDKIFKAKKWKELHSMYYENQDTQLRGMNHIGISCNRLAITGKGLQPFQSQDKKLSIVHNGEIYNFEELRNNLNKNKFVSDTDSEVIVHFLSHELKKGKTIEQACKEFSLKARGSFAVIVLFEKKLYAFRDFIGIRPLWFGKNSQFTAVCSEPKPLRKMDINFPQPLLPGKLLILNSNKIEEKNLFSVLDFKNKIRAKKTNFEKLKNSLIEAVDLRTKNVKKCGVFFSGGIDSSLIALLVGKKVKNVELITVGLENSHDLEASKKAAKELGLKFSPRIVKKSELEKYVFKTLEHLPFFDIMQLQIGIVELIAAEHAFKKGLKVCFSGQGADEIFLGYNYYKDAFLQGKNKVVKEKQWASLENIWNRNLMRDDLMAMSYGIELRLPLLDSVFLENAMQLKVKDNLLNEKDSLRKRTLRKIALEFGLSKSIAFKSKKALQYGSGLGKEIVKLMKKN